MPQISQIARQYQNPAESIDPRNESVLGYDKYGNLIEPNTDVEPMLDQIIDVEVKDRLLMEMKRRLFPAEIEGILYQAITGDMYWQDQLFRLMIDTWPRLQTNLDKLKRAVTSLDYTVTAYKKQGAKDASPSAIDKAETVQAALFNMHGRIAFAERDFKEGLEDSVEAIAKGFIVSEVMWEYRDGAIAPSCTKVIPARYYRFPYLTNATDRLMLNPSGDMAGYQLMDFPENKFLTAIKVSQSGPMVMGPMLRVLTVTWVAQRFGWEWFMTFAQLFGIPYRKATYQEGNLQAKQALVTMLKQAGAQTWGVFPEGTTIELLAAVNGSSTGTPQQQLIATADTVCDIILLGQTLTTDVGDSGSRALGGVHKEVLDEITEAAARYACKIINTQLVRGIIQYNYGNTEELPCLEPVIRSPIELLQFAQALAILAGKGQGQMAIKLRASEVYKRINFTQPDDDDPDILEVPDPMQQMMDMQAHQASLNPDETTQPGGQGKNGAKAGTNKPKNAGRL